MLCKEMDMYHSYYCEHCNIRYGDKPRQLSLCDKCVEKIFIYWGDVNPSSVFIYGLIMNRELVYIGETVNPCNRVYNHLLSDKYFEYMYIFFGVDSKDKAKAVEKEMLVWFHPSLNREKPKISKIAFISYAKLINTSVNNLVINPSDDVIEKERLVYNFYKTQSLKYLVK